MNLRQAVIHGLPQRFARTILSAGLLVLIVASPASALDDLGVVSGDTFELPGYNDGPSGGGVWPGSSGSGGDVGAMPLPNGVPDTGGSPQGGPGGGGGSGAGDPPKVDQTRPPYLAPRNRLTVRAENQFNSTDLDLAGCSSRGLRAHKALAVVTDIDSPVATEGISNDGLILAAERRLRSDAQSIVQASHAVLSLTDFYVDAVKRGLHDRVRKSGDTLGMVLGFTSTSIYDAAGNLERYTNLLLRSEGERGCSEMSDARKLVRAHAYLMTAQASRAVYQDVNDAIQIAASVTMQHHLHDGLTFLGEQAGFFAAEYANFCGRFMLRHQIIWEERYSRQVRELEAMVKGRKP